MTTKTLTVNYPGGYDIGAAYNKLVIDSGITAGSTASSFGVYSDHTAAIFNYGTILASSDADGVDLTAGGNVTNGSPSDTTALIKGGGGIVTSGATVTNFGTIEGAPDIAVYLEGGGVVINGSATDSAASILSGSDNAILAYGLLAATVINFGTISGSEGAVRFKNGAERLIVENKADFIGAVAGGGGALELAGGTDTITGLGGAGVMTGGASASFSGFGTYSVDAGAILTLTGSNDLQTGERLVVDGSLINSGTLKGPTSSGYGVTLLGEMTNGSATDTTALISGYSASVYATFDATVAVANFGTIEAFGAGDSVGVEMNADGSLINGSATDTSALIKGGLAVYSFDSTVTVTNFGTIDGTGGLSVALYATSDRLVVGSGATFIGSIVGDGGTLAFDDGAGTITGLGGSGVFSVGATGSFSGFGIYQLYGGASWALSGGGTIASGKSLDIGASSTATIKGGTLASSGTVVMSAGGVLAGYAGAALDNSGLVSGGGAIYGTMAMTNAASGEIDAYASAMLINNQNGAGLTNDGLIGSNTGETLTLKEVTVSGSGAVLALGTVKLDAAAIDGGTLGVVTGGVLQVASTISTIGSGVTIDNAGTIRVTSGAYLYTSADITGAGSIAIDGVTGTNADLKAVGNVTLSGGGQVSMNVNGFITGYGTSHLTNADTITGGGAIFGSMTVTNSGVIDDNSGAMLINNQNGGGLINNGLIESTSAGDLSFKDVTVTGTGSIDDDYQVKLDDAAINGGTITVGASALFEAIAGTSSIGSAVKLTNNKTLEVISGGTLTIAGSVTNNGIMETVGTGDLTLSGAVAGTGSDRLTGSGNLTIDGTTSQGVAFASTATGDLVLGSSSTFTGAISGLSGSGANAVDLQGVAYNAGDTAKFSGTINGGTLTIMSSAHAVLATLTLKGDYIGKTFTLSNDGSGDTLVKDPPASGPMAHAIAGFGATSFSGAQATASTAALAPLLLAVRS